MREEGAEALTRLRAALGATTVELRLSPGQLTVVDNRLTVNGHTAFPPGYDGKDRWLHRMFARADVRRSRVDQPGDRHVVTNVADR